MWSIGIFPLSFLVCNKRGADEYNKIKIYFQANDIIEKTDKMLMELYMKDKMSNQATEMFTSRLCMRELLYL